jgi:nicotinamidase-related amidase
VTLTTLDARTALIVIDLQKGIVGYQMTHPVEHVRENAATLARAFRTAGLPVVLVNVAGGAPGRIEAPRRAASPEADWAQLVPELDQQPTDITVTKKTWGAFASTNLDELLKAHEVTQVVIVGIATSLGVESTARQAFEAGYNVTLAIDAMTDMNAESHAATVARIFPRLGETGTTAEVLALLGTR